MKAQELFSIRRSINFFDPDRPIPEETLRQILEMAAQAPSSFNLQPWNLIKVEDPAEKEELKALAWDQPKIVDAPVVFIVLADKNGWKENHPTMEKNWREMVAAGIMQEAQRDWFLNAARSLYDWSPEANLAFGVKNSAFFAMSLMYAASVAGLESHPMDGFDHEGVRQAFAIPDHFWIPLLLAVGYKKPDLKLHPPKWRKSPDELLVSFKK